MGTLPLGWHEAHAAPTLPNVGEHDDVALTMPEHDAMRGIAAHWQDDVPCDVTVCDATAQWGRRCDSCHVEWHHCDSDRAMLDRRQAQGVRILCNDCAARQAAPMTWYRL